MKPAVLIVGSRSGGHIVPGLVVGKQWAAQGANVFFCAENRPLDRSLVESESWLTKTFFLDITAPVLSRWWCYPFYGWSFLKTCFQSFHILRSHQITRVIGMGGYSSVPVCCVAWLLRIPYELYELNAELGRAVAVLRYGATTVSCCFPEALMSLHPDVRRLVDYPLRICPATHSIHFLASLENTQGEREKSCVEQGAVLDAFALDKGQKEQDCVTSSAFPSQLISPARPECFSTLRSVSEAGAEKCIEWVRGQCLLVLGGSQGSTSLSKLVLDWVVTLSEAQRSSLFMLHQTGVGEDAIREAYQKLGVAAEVFAYREDIFSVYAQADLIITRAGSGALHEIMYCNKQAVIVPLEARSTHHQIANARSVEGRNPVLWTMIRQRDVTQFQAALNLFCARAQVNGPSAVQDDRPSEDQC